MTFEDWLQGIVPAAMECSVATARAIWDTATVAERDRCVQVATDAARRYTCATRAQMCLALANALRSGT